MKRYVVCLSCVPALCVMLCAAVSLSFAAEKKDTLVIGLKDNSVSLDPAVMYEVTGMQIVHQMYDQLVNFKKDDYSQFVPGLAESWDIGADGKIWTFHLRKGVQFASGNPVNADAVVFSLRRALRLAETPVWILTQLGIAEDSIVKIDDNTVQILLDQQYAPGIFLSCLATPSVASIVDPQVAMEHEQDGDMGSAWLHDHSAGSGPYIIEERTQNEYVMLTANDFYWGEKPVFERVILKNVQDSLEQVMLLKQGELDVAWDLLPAQVEELIEPGFDVLGALTFSIYYLNMNMGYEPLAESEVRDAIRYGIDYDELISFVLEGAAVKIQSFIPKGILGYNPTMPYQHDPEKAKQLLADAGYPDGFDVELNCFDWAPWYDVAMKIKEDLAEIKIRVTVNPQPSQETLQARRSRTFQMLLIRWLFDYADPDANAKSFAHANSSGDDADFKLSAWWCKYVNLETSHMVEQAAQELDVEKRETLYTQIADIIVHDGPFVFLYTPMHQYGLRSEIAAMLDPDEVSEYDLPIPYRKAGTE